MQKLKNEELNRIGIDEFKQAEKTPIVIVLDNVRSLNNIGSVFRTADAFRVESIYLCGITATPPNKEIHKTALGATESVNWKYLETTELAVHELKKQNYFVCAVEQAIESVMLDEVSFESNKKIALVFGNEVNGVSDDVMQMCDTCIEIPQLGTKHSLNISVSVGILVWDVWQKLSAKKNG